VALSFDEFVAAHGLALRRLAFLLCGDIHRSEDLTQSALATVFRKWARVQRMNHPAAYARQVLVREYASWRRRRPATELVVEDAASAAGVNPLVADHADDVAAADAVWQALATLPRQQRAVLVLRFYLDLDDQAISEVLKCSASTVRSNAVRGLRTLRENGSMDSEEVPS
jgi:RNA polymerase sigma-70 factor (sigma-E family)